MSRGAKPWKLIREEECKADRVQSFSHTPKLKTPVFEDSDEDEVQAARAYIPQRSRSVPQQKRFPPKQYYTYNPKASKQQSQYLKQCIVCKMAGRKRFNHSLAECDQISQADKRHAIRSLTVSEDAQDLEYLHLDQDDE